MPDRKKKKNFKWAILLTESEYTKIKAGMSNSTCRSMSEYGRKLILARPVTVFYRNQSFDDAIEEMIVLRNELGRLRNEFQEKEKQSFLPHSDKIASLGALYHENLLEFIHKIEEIKETINKFYDTCSQK